MAERWADRTDGEIPGWLRAEMRQAFSQSSILLVEDDRDIRELLTTLLGLAGFDTTACASAEEGLQQLRQSTFDLILTDYMLPHHSGGWLLRQAASEGLIDATPVLVVTAHPEPPDVTGFEIVQKPFDLDDIVARVQRRLEGGLRRPKLPIGGPRPVAGTRNGNGNGSGRGSDCPEPIEVILYMSAHSPGSAQAVANIKQRLARFSRTKVKLTICDLSKDPQKGAADAIAFTPTLVKRAPGPRTFILGHITNPEVVSALLAECVEE